MEFARDKQWCEKGIELGHLEEAHMRQRKLTSHALRRFTDVRYCCIQ